MSNSQSRLRHGSGHDTASRRNVTDDGYDSPGDGRTRERDDRLIFRDNAPVDPRRRGYHDDEEERNVRMSSSSVSNSSLNQVNHQHHNQQRYQPQHASQPNHPNFSAMNHVNHVAPTSDSASQFRVPMSSASYVDQNGDTVVSDGEILATEHPDVMMNETMITADGQVGPEQQATSDDEQHQDQVAGSSSFGSRPSLRYRRDFRCPNLVIFNKSSNSLKLSTQNIPSDTGDGPQAAENTDRTTSTTSSASSTNNSKIVKSIQLPKRRLTLPGIIKYPAPDVSRRSQPSVSSRWRSQSSDRTSMSSLTSAQSGASDGLSVRGGKPATEMFIVENCSRRRLEEFEIIPATPSTQRNNVSTIPDTSSSTRTVNADPKQASSEHVPVVTRQIQLPLERSTLAVTSPDGLDPPKPITRRYRSVHQ